jgi:hypothetical protein
MGGWDEEAGNRLRAGDKRLDPLRTCPSKGKRDAQLGTLSPKPLLVNDLDTLDGRYPRPVATSEGR